MLIGAGIGIPFQQNVLARLLGSAEFFAPLTHSAIPTRAASGTTGTFTRATTSTWPNNDGYMVTGVAGEIGFVGARRVRNRLTFTEDVTNPAWSLGGLTAPSASSIKETAVSIAHSLYRTDVTGTATWQLQAEVKPDGRDWVAVWFFAAGTVKGILANVATGAFVSNLDGANLVSSYDITATDNGYYRVSIVGTLALVQCGFSASDSATPTLTATKLPTYLGDITKGLFVRKFQLEDITGRTDQTTPSEYVSAGVESAPYYHGSMVDGVKCFPTDLSGNPIPSTTLLGYQAEGARTNLCLQSQTLGTTWAADSSTSVTADQYVAPDGTTTMDKVTSLAGTSQHYLKQGITFSAGVTTYSFYLRYVNNQWCALVMSNGGGLLAASFDLLNGVVGALGAGTTSTIQATAIADVYRVSITGTMSAGAGDLFISPNSTDTASIQNYTAAGTETVGAWGAQLELGSFASSYIATTTLAVARNADVLTYSSAGNALDAAGWAYAEVTSNVIDGNYGTHISSAAQRMLDHWTSTNASMNDGVSEVTKTGLTAINTGIRKRASTWNTAFKAVTGDGATPATQASYDGTFLGATIGIGYREASGTEHIFGTIRNVRIGQRQLSASELGAITS